MVEAFLCADSPFIVGVSGHRDLHAADLAPLRAAVGDFVQQLKRRLPDTSLRFIIGMAEGADLLVAQTVLDLDVSVEAVLPMPLAAYAEDFDAAHLAALKALLARPGVRCVELSPPAEPGGTVAGMARDALYSNLTETLIRRSCLLLAIWDGRPSPLPGGTADTVLRYLGVRTQSDPVQEKIHYVAAGSDIDTVDRLVYWAPTARAGDTRGSDERAACYLRGVGDHTLETQRAMPAQLAHQLEALNHYNREYRQLSDRGRLGTPDSLLASLPAGAGGHAGLMLEDIDAQYGKADTLAMYFQRRSDRLFLLFSVMAFTMGLAYLIYEKITESRVVLVIYLMVLLSSLGLYYILEGRRWFAKHLTYRAIAETMRAKFYLRLGGVDHRVDAWEVLALSGIDRFRGFGWIGYVLTGVETADLHVAASPAAAAQRSDCVEQSWIENQHRYFTGKVARLKKSSLRIKRLRNTLFVVILLVIMTLFLFGEELHGVRVAFGMLLSNLLTFCMGFLAVLLGVWELHQNKMATRELLWQYQNQLRHFARARAQLARITTPRHRDRVLVDLGKDSLMESYLWTIHRYHREHEPPGAS